MAQGYVEEAQDGVYKFTDKAGELVRASAASKVSRKTAEDALAGLLKRVEQYNLDSDKIFTIETVVVFGSFLGTGDKLGDLDVAVKKRDRNLKDSDRTDIQPWNVFLRMAVNNPDRIPYKVVFGSTDEVAAEILDKKLNNGRQP